MKHHPSPDPPPDPTCDPTLRSFIAVDPQSHFPIQNLPFGVCELPDGGGPRVCTRVGDRVVDLARLAKAGVLGHPALQPALFDAPTLNALMAQGRPAWRAARETLSKLLHADEPTLRDDARLREATLVPSDAVTPLLPVEIGDYTDFYSSKEHATNVGIMFRGKENALMPNWLELPVGYHGRSSSIVVSGTDIVRPRGQTMPEGAERPVYGPSRRLDFELEMGFFIGVPSELGRPIPAARAHEHIFGMVLVNDWSARDIQKWEYQPLGPFNAKNFATSISPWVVTLDALEPFRGAGPPQSPEPLDYLRGAGDRAYDVELEVWIRGAKMAVPERISASNFRHMYWNVSQQLVHHTVTGCNVRTGDMMASGTISAPDPGGYGSLLELTWRGTKPIRLAGGEERRFIADGDTITMAGFCQGDGFRVGFGEVSGTILPALA